MMKPLPWMKQILNSSVMSIPAIVLSLVIGFTTHGGTEYHVDKTATGAGDGSSWQDACPTLQDALGIAHAPNNPAARPYIIKIAQGTYAPDEYSTGDTDDPEETFNVRYGDVVIGGYAGLAGQDPEANDPELYETILTGLVDTGVHCEHVVTVTNPSGYDAEIVGVTIAGGESPDLRGGVLAEGPAFPALTYFLFVTNCVITGNTVDGAGGGIAYSLSATPYAPIVIRNCGISGNTSTGQGGGMAIRGGANIINSVIEDNTAGSDGGGVEFTYAIEINMVCSRVTGNVSEEGNGGGIHAFGLDPEFSIAGVTNCLFDHNSAEDSTNGLGGGIWSDDIRLSIWGTTVADNTARRGGGMRYGGGVGLNTSGIDSSIFWDNVSNQSIGHEILIIAAPLQLDYCDVEDRNNSSSVSSSVTWGTGNIGENTADNPDFVNAASGNYKLSCSSPCINTGDPDADDDFPSDTFDADEDSNTSEEAVDLGLGHRILGPSGDAFIDMGTFESHGDPDCPADVTGNGAIDINDLLAVINSWGQPGLTDIAPDCSGDGVTNINDLLAIINNWGTCGESPEELPESIADCWDFADRECEESEDPECWEKTYAGCLAYLCAEEIIEDCD